MYHPYLLRATSVSTSVDQYGKGIPTRQLFLGVSLSELKGWVWNSASVELRNC